MKLYTCNGVVNRRLGAQGLGFLGAPEAPGPDIVAAPLVAIVPQAPVIELQVTELHVDMLHTPQPAAGSRTWCGGSRSFTRRIASSLFTWRPCYPLKECLKRSASVSGTSRQNGTA
jgi:hypothetical protein